MDIVNTNENFREKMIVLNSFNNCSKKEAEGNNKIEVRNSLAFKRPKGVGAGGAPPQQVHKPTKITNILGGNEKAPTSDIVNGGRATVKVPIRIPKRFSTNFSNTLGSRISGNSGQGNNCSFSEEIGVGPTPMASGRSIDVLNRVCSSPIHKLRTSEIKSRNSSSKNLNSAHSESRQDSVKSVGSFHAKNTTDVVLKVNSTQTESGKTWKNT